MLGNFEGDCELFLYSCVCQSELGDQGSKASKYINRASHYTLNSMFSVLSHVFLSQTKLYFYEIKLQISRLIPYPMDNCFTSRTVTLPNDKKAVLYIIPAGPVMECAFARWCIIHPSSLDMLTSLHLFCGLILLRPLVS